MQVKKIKENAYIILNKNAFYTMELYTEQEKMIISISEHNTGTFYKSAFTLNYLTNICQSFRLYDSIQEILEEIQEELPKKAFQIIQDQGKINIFFPIMKKLVLFPLPLVEENYKKPILHLSFYLTLIKFLISHYENSFKTFTREITLIRRRNKNFTNQTKQINLEVKKNSDRVIESIKHLILNEGKGILLRSHMDEAQLKSQNFTENEAKNSSIQEDKGVIKADKPKRNLEEKITFPETAKIKLVRTIKEHNDKVNSICLLRYGKIASCSSDQTIKIHNLATNKCDQVLTDHSRSVTYVSELENGNLISSSVDNTIKIWKLKSNLYECIQTLVDHKSYVNKVIGLSGNRIGSCSRDKTIKVWDASYPTKCLKTLEGHTSFVVSLIELKNKKYLVSASWDNTLKFWCGATYRLERTFKKIFCCGSNGIEEIGDNKIAIGCKKTITIINTEKFEVVKEIQIYDNSSVNSFMEFVDGTILTGCNMGKILHYNSNFLRCFQNIESAHTDTVRGFAQISKKEFASCSDDCTIKIWIRE